MVIPLLFQPGGYFLRLILSDSLGAGWQSPSNAGRSRFIYDTNIFHVDGKPSNGSCVVRPTEGEQVITNFTVASLDWIEDDLPLKHRFSWQNSLDASGAIDHSEVWIFINGWTQLMSISTVFGNIGGISIRAEAMDTLGSTEMASAEIVVRAPDVPVDNSKLISIIDSITRTGDASAVAATVSAVASVSLSSKPPQNKQREELATKLIDALASSSAALKAPTNEVVDSTASALEATLRFAVPSEPNREASQPPPPVNMAIATQGADLVNRVATAALRVEGGLRPAAAVSLVKSVGSLVGTVAVEANNGGKNGATQRKQQKALSAQLRAATTSIASAMVKAAPIGKTVKVRSAFLELSAKKADKTSLLKNGSTIEDFTLPPLPPSVLSRRLAACAEGYTLQNTKWTHNPFGYAGNTFSGNQSSSADIPTKIATNISGLDEATVLGSKVECCSVEGQSVQTMEVHSCGKAVALANLAEPVVFELSSRAARRQAVSSTYDATLQYDELWQVFNEGQVCQFFDEKASAWSDHGCTTRLQLGSGASCSCNHLTSFSVAWKKTFGSLGSNKEALLKKPFKLDFHHGPFIALLVIFFFLFAPMLYFCGKDFQDYDWLSKRDNLFLDRVQGPDFDRRIQVIPGTAYCCGWILCDSMFCNLSLQKRRLRSLIRCGPCRAFLAPTIKSEVIEDAQMILPHSRTTVEVDVFFQGFSSRLIDVLGPEGLELHLYEQATEPPLREPIRRQMKQLLFAHGGISDAQVQRRLSSDAKSQLWGERVGERVGLSIAGRIRARFAKPTDRDHLYNASSVVRHLQKKNSECSMSSSGTPRISFIGMPSIASSLPGIRKNVQSPVEMEMADLAYSMEVRYLLVQHLALLTKIAESNTLSANSCFKRWRSERKFRTLRKKTEKCKKAMCSELISALKSQVEDRGGVFPCTQLPPLLSMRCQVVSSPPKLCKMVEKMEDNRRYKHCVTSVTTGQNVFIWLLADGDLAVHAADVNASDDSWKLAVPAHTILLPVDSDERIQPWHSSDTCTVRNASCVTGADLPDLDDGVESGITVRIQKFGPLVLRLCDFANSPTLRGLLENWCNPHCRSSADADPENRLLLEQVSAPNQGNNLERQVSAISTISLSPAISPSPAQPLGKSSMSDHQASSDSQCQSPRANVTIPVPMSETPCLNTPRAIAEEVSKDETQPPGLRCPAVPSDGISAVRDLPLPLQRMCALEPYIFRYMVDPTHNTHSSTGPLEVRFKDESFLCKVWFSHGGLVVSLQPFGHQVCFGIYLHDITSVVGGAYVKITLGSPELEGSDAKQLFLSSSSEWCLQLFCARLQDALRETRMGDEDVESRPIVACRSMGRRLKAIASDFTAEDGQEDDEFMRLLAKWLKVRENLMHSRIAYPLPCSEAAAKVAHKFWPSSDITTASIEQNHFFPKLMKYVVGVTRSERYAMFLTSLSVAFFSISFWFDDNCFMHPKPVFCLKPALSWHMKYFGWAIPGWDTFLSALFAVMFGAVPPFILVLFFRKPRVFVIMTKEEKISQRIFWRIFQTIGWCLVIGFNIFSSYYLILFAHEYEWIVFRKFLNAVLQGTFHRSMTSPIGRGAGIAMLVISARLCSPVDTCLVYFCPHIFPVQKMEREEVQEGDGEGGEAEEGDAGDDGGNLELIGAF